MKGGGGKVGEMKEERTVSRSNNGQVGKEENIVSRRIYGFHSPSKNQPRHQKKRARKNHWRKLSQLLVFLSPFPGEKERKGE